MPPKGRPPVPTEIRNAQGGSVGKGAVSHRRAKSPVVLGQRVVDTHTITPFIPLPPAGQKMWDEIVVHLIEYNVATTLDAPNLTLMCIHWADLCFALEAMSEEGRYDFGSTGQVRKSPLLADFHESANKFSKLAEQYGLTAVARTRLAMLDVTTRSIESDLASRLGTNPRRTNRPAIERAKREIEKD